MFSVASLIYGFDNQLNMEIFSPPYLFAGPRPQITATPPTAGYADPVSIDTPDEPDIASVTLVRPAAVTHHTDANARFIRLAIISRGAGQVLARAPSGPTVAPPGYYLLFVMNSEGVPSVGQFILIQ